MARGEAAIAAAVLLLLILVAAAQALLRNLTLVHVSWANAVLEHLSWGDSFMQKATLWLAFLGASLATHNEKHIAIDVLARISPKRARALISVFVGLFSSVTCFYLARVFFQAVTNNAGSIPIDLSVMDEAGLSQHVCDAGAAALADASLTRLFCAVRASLQSIGASISTPDTALQLIAPAMFLAMSVRFAFHSVVAGMNFSGYAADAETIVLEETVSDLKDSAIDSPSEELDDSDDSGDSKSGDPGPDTGSDTGEEE